MNLIPVEKRIALREEDGSLTAAHNRRLWILGRGDPDREIPVNAGIPDLSGETVLPIYADPAGLVELEPPVFSDSAGRFPYWHHPDGVDYYSPDDPINPIEPVEKPPGWVFRGGGLRLGVLRGYDPPHDHDYTLSDRWGIKPGRRSSGPAAPALAARVGGWWTDMRAMRSVVEGMIRIIEASDPSELRFGRTPGQNIYDITGGESIFRKHPVGHSTIVSADAAPDATEVFLARTKSFPEYYDGSVADVSLMVDGQAVTYESISAVKATLSGDHPLFATELTIADNQNPDLPVPSSGRIRLRGLTLAHTGKEQIFAGEADGLHKAGGETLVVRNVSQAEWDAIPHGEGALLVQVVGVNSFRRLKYTAATYDSGTEKATFTLDETTKVARNVPDAATVTMHRLTGITSDFQGPTLGHRLAGMSTLTLDKIHPDSGAEVDPALVAKIPSSGVLRFETEVLQSSGPGKWDYPIEELAYTDFDGDTFTLAELLPADVPEASWMWIEGCEGLLRDRNSGTALTMNRLNGVTGLAAGASTGAIAEFSPRYRQPGQGTATDGFITNDKWEPGGWSAHKTLIGFGGAQGGVGEIDPGGRVGVTITAPGSGFRLPVMSWLSKGIGILGSGVRGDNNIAHNLHVGDVYCRVQPPNIELDCDCDPSDEECECDDEGGPGQIASATVNVNTTVGFPTASRVKTSIHNRETGGTEEREFDYTGVTEGPPPSITGFTFDQSSQGPKTALDGSHDLAVVSALTVDATDGFAAPQAQHVGKLRAKDAEGDVVATFIYTAKTNFTFTGLVVTSGSGTLPDDTLIEEDYALGDFWLDSGAEISLADNVRHAAFGSATNSKTGTDRPAELQTEAGVVGPNGEPGYAIGDEQLIRDEDDDLAWAGNKLQDKSEKGVDNGYTPLDSSSKVPLAHLPSSVLLLDGSVTAAKFATLPAARVRHSAAQAIPTGTDTILAFDAEDYDTADLHDTATNNSRLVAPVAGIYAISGRVSWQGNATGRRLLTLRVNGATNIANDRVQPISEAGVATDQDVATDYVLAAGDYVELRARQDSGGNLNVQSATPNSPVLAMRFVSAAPGAPPPLLPDGPMHLADALHQLRSSDCSTAFFRPDVDPNDIRNIDNGYLEGGVAISLSAKTYTGVRFAIVQNEMPIVKPAASPSVDYIVDFRLCAWDYETKALLATTANLAAELNALPREGDFDPQFDGRITADFLTPLSLLKGERVILGTAMYGDYPCRNIANASVNAFKHLMEQTPQLGFNNKSAVAAATQAGEFPTGGYVGGTPGAIGSDVSGNYPWMDLVPAL